MGMVMTLGITLAGHNTLTKRNEVGLAPFERRQGKFKTSSDW
jgi:hypothetical protein